MIAGGYDPVEDMLKVKSVQKKWRDTFNGPALDPARWDLAVTGTGMAVSQGNGSLTITTGTTLDDAVTITSREAFSVPFRAMVGLNLSQRIAGQTVLVGMVSVDRDTGLPDERDIAAWRLDGGSATQAIYDVAANGSPRLLSAPGTVTTTAKGTSELTGAGLEIELFADEAWFHARALDSNAARGASFCRTTQVPDPNRLYRLRIRVLNRQVLAGITAVADNGSGGVRVTRNGHGLATGDVITLGNVAGIPALATPWTGTVTVINANGFDLDGAAFAGAYVNTGWAQFSRNAPPASSTTVNLLFASVLDYAELTAEITAGRGQSAAAQALAVQVAGGALGAQGLAARGSNAAGNPLYVATGLGANPSAVSSGRNVDLLATLIGALVTKPYSIPEADWSYATDGTTNTPLTTTADRAIRAAAGVGIRNYLTAVQLQNTHATQATDVVVKDGAATVLWRGPLPAAMAAPLLLEFPTPLRGSANAALNLACVTAGANVVANAQGYAAP